MFVISDNSQTLVSSSPSIIDMQWQAGHFIISPSVWSSYFYVQDREDSEKGSDPGSEISLILYSILAEKSSDNKYQVQLADDCQDFLHYNNTLGSLAGFYFSCDGTNYSNLAICKKSVSGTWLKN